MEIFTIRDLRERTGDLVRNAEEGHLAIVARHGHPLFVADAGPLIAFGRIGRLELLAIICRRLWSKRFWCGRARPGRTTAPAVAMRRGRLTDSP
jgi:hypothetical protein